ncbi:hypothetical protein GCM10028827_32120 [Mucilaginibacter myungsuensis]
MFMLLPFNRVQAGGIIVPGPSVVRVWQDTIPTPDSIRIQQLANLISYQYNRGERNWDIIVGCADKIWSIDSGAYYKQSVLYYIADAKFNIGDHAGALKDLLALYDIYSKSRTKIYGSRDMKEKLAQCYLRLERPEPAVMLYANIALPQAFAQVFKVCKDYNNRKLYRRAVDTAIAGHQEAFTHFNIDRYSRWSKTFVAKGHYPAHVLIDYAYLLLMVNRPQKALKVINMPLQASPGNEADESMLAMVRAMAQYLIKPGSFNSIKMDFTASVTTHGKITYQGYSPLSDWLKYSDIPMGRRQGLLELEAIAK